MGTRIRIDSVMRPRSSSRGAQYKCLSYSYSYSSIMRVTNVFQNFDRQHRFATGAEFLVAEGVFSAEIHHGLAAV